MFVANGSFIINLTFQITLYEFLPNSAHLRENLNTNTYRSH